MGIIQTPVTYTDDLVGKQARTKDQISRVSTSGFTGLKLATLQLFSFIWKNPYGLTPQEAFDSLGADAASLHSLFAPVSQLVNAALPNSLDLSEPKAVTANQDGTVTVGA